jgi:hypothetical protein
MAISGYTATGTQYENLKNPFKSPPPPPVTITTPRLFVNPVRKW